MYKQLGRYFLSVIVPTRLQLLTAVLVSSAVLVVGNMDTILVSLGISSGAIAYAMNGLHTTFNAALNSPIMSNIVLVAFWALVGLGTYLVSWAGFNIIVEAQNEVTLKKDYTNRGHWKGPWQTLGLKMLFGLVLVAMLMEFAPILVFWNQLILQSLSAPLEYAIGGFAGAILGFAAQIYLVLAAVILTFSSWYTEKSFTK